MAPDLPYFVPGPTGRDLTHTLLGVVTVDLAIGVLVYAAWLLVIRAPAVDLAPHWLRQRLPPAAASSSRLANVALLVASLIVGTLTHLAWDFFTHPGPLESLIPFLGTQVGPLTPTKWLQHGSSLFGLGVIVWWTARWVRRTRPVPTPSRLSGSARVTTWLAVVGTFVAVAVLVWSTGVSDGYPALDPYLVFTIARKSIGAAIVVAGAAVVAWQVGRLGRDYSDRSTATTLPSTSA